MESIFVCRKLPGHLGDYIRDKGYKVELIETSAEEFRFEEDAAATRVIVEQSSAPVDWLIVDHYGIDREWEAALRPFADRILVIDDLANRPHECDFLLDQNAYDRMGMRYDGLVPLTCRQLLGPHYLLLRPSFYEARRTLQARAGDLQRLLIFFGGSDPTNETSKALQALAEYQRSPSPLYHVDVVIGSSNPIRQEIVAVCDGLPGVKLHVQAENMAELIENADFALGAGGVAMWERCYLGLPTAVTVVADNQAESVQFAVKKGAVEFLGRSGDVSGTNYYEAIRRAVESPATLMEMSRRAFELTNSVADRTESLVLSAMLALDTISYKGRA